MTKRQIGVILWFVNTVRTGNLGEAKKAITIADDLESCEFGVESN